MEAKGSREQAGWAWTTRLEALPGAPTLLLVLLAFGTAARCRQYFACLSYWYDEAYLLLNVFEKSFAGLAGPLEYQQAAPPLFLWLLRGLYLLGGPSEGVMRLPSLVAGLAALFLLVPLARCLAGKQGGTWVVGWCALSHHAAYHSAEVKPYALDLLATTGLLLAAVRVLQPDTSPRHRRVWGMALILGAAFAPWLSFPSVFILGGISLALLLETWRRREQSLGPTWAGLTALLALSSLALWGLAARHQNSPVLQQLWGAHFPDLSSPGVALAWTVACAVDIGHYGSTGLGVPLLIGAVCGLVVLGRRSPAVAVALAAPLGLAWAASALRLYPLGNRLTLFALPCLYLPAAAGLEAVTRRLRVRWPAVSLALTAAVLLPGAVPAARALATGPTGIEFREAFAHVRRHRIEGDHVWVSHPEVYEVYFGRPAWLLGPRTPLGEVERAAGAGRLWLVFTRQGHRRASFTEVFECVRAQAGPPVSREKLRGLEIVLYGPPGSDQEARRSGFRMPSDCRSREHR